MNDDQAKKVVSIFLAEDDMGLAKILEMKLSAKFTLLSAADGEEAIEKLKNLNAEKLSLVLLDIMMPKKSGLEVLQWLKSQDSLKDIPVVMLSNLSSAKDVKDAMDLGATGYIAKADHTLAEIMEKIDSYITSS